MNKQMTTKKTIIFVIVIAIAVFIAMQVVYGQGLDSPADVRIKEIVEVMKQFYAHNSSEGHSLYFIPTDEIDKYSKDMLLYYNTFKNNNSIVFPEPHISHIHNLDTICVIHEHPKLAGYIKFEKKLENCDLFDEFFTKFMAHPDWSNERDYRDSRDKI